MAEINCSKCGHSNQEHYKRCLMCGTSLEYQKPLVEKATAQGRYCYVTTYTDGGSPIQAQLLFHDPKDAAECARILNEARKPK